MLRASAQKADQTPSSVIRLPSSQVVQDTIDSRPGLSRRTVALIEAIRAATVTDPSAGGLDRLRHLAAGLRAAIDNHGIRQQDGTAGETIPGVTKGFDASDQYFLVMRDDGNDPVEVLLEGLIAASAGVFDDIAEQGSTLTDLEKCALVIPLTLAGGLVDDAFCPSK
jgi:hypothetical protein